MRRILFVLSLLVALGCGHFAVEAQKVRLRSRITPNCGVTSDLKFADIWADGNIAVMGTYNCRGAFIFDVSNPDELTLANWYNPSPNQSFLEAIVIGNRGYFGSGGQGPSSPTTGDGVHIVDLTNPQSPLLLGKVNSTSGGGFNGIHEMVIFDQGGQRFLIENYNSFATKIIKVINITDPAAPVFVRDITPTEISWVHAFHIRGTKMYTSGWGTGSVKGRTEIYDISNIATQAPTLLGFIEDANASATNGNNMHSSWTSEDGNYLYSAREVTNSSGASPGDVRVYDVSNAATPLLVNRVTMADLGLNAVTPHNPVVMGNKLFVSWYQAGLQVFDLSSPTIPNRVGQYDTYAAAFREPDASAKSLSDESWDIICGRDSLQNSLPTTYNGTWAVFPFLGEDKVLIGEMGEGLLIVDTTQATAPRKNVVSDFDGDRKTDLSRFAPATGVWTIENSSTASLGGTQFGLSDDVIAPADYDGDGKTDVAIWRPSSGDWWIARSSGGISVVNFGLAQDVPVAGDFDADGKADIAVWRPSNGVWYIWQSTLGIRYTQWGVSGDKPVTGDWDGDGKTDIAVFRPAQGVWYIMPSSSSIPMIVQWGIDGDRPVSGDFTGDGKTELTVYRPGDGNWWILDASAQTFSVYKWGIEEDIPVQGDYDGDEKADIAVYRPSDGVWYRLNSSDWSYSGFVFGAPGDRPSPASVNPF
ncbi:MAG: FG-GAP-like repeat-containing protein [Pyrinomonadaceae bacterium]